MSAAEQLLLPRRHSWPCVLDVGPLRLRPLQRADAGAWQEVRERNDEWLRPWDATTPPGFAQEFTTFRGMVATLNRRARAHAALPWALEWRGVNPRPLIGQVVVSSILLGSGRWGQAGYWVDQELAGHGLAPTALAAACDYAWRVMRVHRVEVAIQPANARSLRVVQKLGFRAEGLRPNYIHIDGEWRDHLIFALNEDEVPEGLLSRRPAVQMIL